LVTFGHLIGFGRGVAGGSLPAPPIAPVAPEKPGDMTTKRDKTRHPLAGALTEMM